MNEIEDDLLNAGCATRRHGCEQLLDGPRLDESGGELLDPDPWLAKRLLARGEYKSNPSEAIAWFNLGIGLHQQRRISAAVRAYRHCLALPHSKETEQAARNNLGAGFAPAWPLARGMESLRPAFCTQTGKPSLV